MKVNASALRQGNVIDVEGTLYAVLTAENIKPGKGTPVTQLELRRLSDGVKITERYRTTEPVERAYIEEGTYQYLYAEDGSFAFMETETFNQISVPKEIVGDQAVYLQDGMQVTMRVHQGTPVAVQLPARVTLEVVETEPFVKRQTAQSSYKPALLSNGVRTTVPPHITPGTRIVVSTADGSYQERAKD